MENKSPFKQGKVQESLETPKISRTAYEERIFQMQMEREDKTLLALIDLKIKPVRINSRVRGKMVVRRMPEPIKRGRPLTLGPKVRRESDQLSSFGDYESYLDSIDWLWPEHLMGSNVHLVAGSPGVGKTWFLLGLARIVANGLELPGGTPNPYGEPRKVFFLETEGRLNGVMRRMKAIGIDTSNILFWPKTRPPFDYANPLDRELFEKAIARKDVGLVLIDSFRQVGGGELEKDGRIGNKINWFSQLSVEAGVPVVMSHHTKKPSSYSPYDRPDANSVSGSNNIVGQCSHVSVMYRHNPTDNRNLAIEVVKNEHGDPGKTVTLKILTNEFDEVDIELTHEIQETLGVPTKPRSKREIVEDEIRAVYESGVPVLSEDFYESLEGLVSDDYAKKIVSKSNLVFTKKGGSGVDYNKGSWYVVPTSFDENDWEKFLEDNGG